MSSDGYFQMHIWFWAAVEEKPCVETISCDVSDQVRLQTLIRIKVVRFRRHIYDMGMETETETYLASRIQLAEHVPKLHVPKPYMLILRPTTRRKDTRYVRVPRERFDSRRVFVELPQRRRVARLCCCNSAVLRVPPS